MDGEACVPTTRHITNSVKVDTANIFMLTEIFNHCSHKNNSFSVFHNAIDVCTSKYFARLEREAEIMFKLHVLIIMLAQVHSESRLFRCARTTRSTDLLQAKKIKLPHRSRRTSKTYRMSEKNPLFRSFLF